MTIQINKTELVGLIEEEAAALQGCPFYSKSNTVIGEVNGQVIVLTVMNKATACDEFDGNDYTNLNLVKEGS